MLELTASNSARRLLSAVVCGSYYGVCMVLLGLVCKVSCMLPPVKLVGNAAPAVCV